jgi:beta-lactamase regulating signal transducer with metallopeptidase domain
MNATELNHWFDLAFMWTWTTSLQASVLIALVIAAQLLFRKWLKPHWRYALGFLVLVRLLLPWAPASSFSVFNLRDLPISAARRPTGLVVAPEIQQPNPELASTSVGVNPIILSAPSLSATTARRITLLTAAKATWLAGFALFLGLAGWQHRRFSREVNGSEEIAEPRLLRLLEDAKAAMRVTQPVRLVKTDRLATPALFGLRKPCLLIPEALLRRLDEEEWRLVFLHELAHLRRGDVLLNWVMIAIRALHWFNPLVWFALRRLRSDRELLCDAMVLNRLDASERRTYGNTLIKLAESFSQPRLCPTLVPALGHKHEITRRVMMIAQFKPATRFAVIFSIALLLSICCFTFTRAADKNVEAPRPKVGEPTVSKEYSYESNRAENSRRALEKFREQEMQAAEKLKKAREELDALRQHFGISDQDGKGPLGVTDPETVRMIERDRIAAEGMSSQYNSILQSLRQKSRKELKDTIPTVYPDTLLSDLLKKLNQAENQYAEDSSQFKSLHPKVAANKALIANLNEQIEARVDGVLQGLEALANASKARAEEIEKQLQQAKEKHAEKMIEYRPYFEAKREVETQQRIYEIIKLRTIHEAVDANLPRSTNQITAEQVEALRQFLDTFFPKKPAAGSK